MAGGKEWTPAPENTLESLRHALSLFDGIEFDIRITADHQLIIHHDRTVSVPERLREGKPTWLEEWTLDELVDLGFLSFEAFLDDKTVQTMWRDEGKMGCIEIKRPHPKAPTGGGFFGRRHHNNHIAEAMKLAEKILDERDIPCENTVFYALSPGHAHLRSVIGHPTTVGGVDSLHSALRHPHHTANPGVSSVPCDPVSTSCQTAPKPREFNATVRHRILPVQHSTPPSRSTCRAQRCSLEAANERSQRDAYLCLADQTAHRT